MSLSYLGIRPLCVACSWGWIQTQMEGLPEIYIVSLSATGIQWRFSKVRICRNLPEFGKLNLLKLLLKQDCIPVGCIPPACWPYLPACTVHCAGGGCLLLVWCLLLGGGACLGGLVSQHALRQTPPVDRILDTRYWKYYLAPNFVCGR